MDDVAMHKTLLVAVIILSGCTSSVLKQAEDIYDTPENQHKQVMDDERTQALRSMLPQQYQLQKTNVTMASIGGAATGAYIGYAIATSQGVSNISNATTAKGAVDAYNKARQAQVTNSIVGAAAGSVVVAFIVDGMNKQRIKELYQIEGEPSEAFNYLADQNSDVDSGLKAVVFIEATMKLREKPEPQLGQLYVDAAYSTLRACRLKPSSFELGKKRCTTAINIMASLNLPTQLALLPDRSAYMPK
jgi:outer membrane lipoprotein SlyB